MSKAPKIVLITTGIRRVAHFFPSLPGQPIGIINWNNQQPTEPSVLLKTEIARKIYAKLRRRTYASLQHVSISNNLLYADIHKQDADTLQRTLAEWDCDLVITSNCSFVPTQALANLSHGTLNMHPSWLPDYRGAEPVLWQIAAGEETLATSIHRLSDEYDRGTVVAQHRVPRPHGASRDTLADITEAELGRAMLERAINILIENPRFAGKEQPEKSSTTYAYRKSADAFAEDVALDRLEPTIVWDLMHYFGRCPTKWLGNIGWRKRFTWQPISIRHSANNAVQTKWETTIKGLTVNMHNGQTTITLKPKRSSLLRIFKP